jgi:hypothetical protein
VVSRQPALECRVGTQLMQQWLGDTLAVTHAPSGEQAASPPVSFVCPPACGFYVPVE